MLRCLSFDWHLHPPGGGKTPSVTNNRVCCWWSFHLLWTAGTLQSGSGLQCDRRCQNLRHGSNIPTEVHLCGLMFCVEIRIACGSAVIETMYIEHLSISIFTCELWKVLLVCSLGMKLNAIRLFGWWPSCLVYTHLQWLPLTFQRDLKALFIACELGSCLISGSPMLYSRKDWITCCRHFFSPSISAGWAFSKLDFIDGALNFWKEMANVVLKQAISSHGLIHLIFDIPMIFPHISNKWH